MNSTWEMTMMSRLVPSAVALTVICPVLAGSLTPPPGPPLPTMKTIAQVEPRTAVEDLPGDAAAMHVVDAPGSYVLGTDLADGTGRAAIAIRADNVTLDLGGFTLQGSGGTGTALSSGIVVDGPHRSVTVRNGTIRGWGCAALAAEQCEGCVATRLLVQHNGLDGTCPALRLGALARVHDCSAVDNPNWTGIQTNDLSIITGSTANHNGNGYEMSGEHNLIVRSHAYANGNLGIYVQAGAIVEDCVAAANDVGVKAGSDAVVRQNTAWANRVGITTEGEDALVEDNHVKGSFDWGLRSSIVNGGVVFRNNRCTGNGLAISTDASGVNMVTGNTLAGNTTDISGGGVFGILLDLTGGSVVAGGSPWANIRY